MVRRARKARSAFDVGRGLADVEQAFDGWTGRRTDIAGHVMRYRRARAVLAAYRDDERRAVIHQAASLAVARGIDRDATDRIVVDVRPDRSIRRILSDPVKAVNATLWDASRVEAVSLAIRHGDPVRLAEPRVRTVSELIDTMRSDAVRIAEAERVAEAERIAVLAVFCDVAAATVWEGETLCTADGWTLGYSTATRFSGGRCAELAPTFGVDVDDITAAVRISGGTYYRLASMAADDETSDTYSE